MMTWAGWAWDPMTGCTHVSEGCSNCIVKWRHLKLLGEECGGSSFEPTVHFEEFRAPIDEARPRSILVVPQGDIFHENFSQTIIHVLLDVMREASHHVYYILTKRHERMHRCLTSYKHWPLVNVNVGVSVENQRWLEDRLPLLLDVPVDETAHRFLSCEPLLGPVFVGSRINELGRIIVGAERGCDGRARPCDSTWLSALREECAEFAVPFYHHGSGDLRREQIPSSDRVMRERQCLARLREYRYGRQPLLLILKEIARQEGITWNELTRRIGSDVKSKSRWIARGIIPESVHKKAWAFVDAYYDKEKVKCG